MGAIKVFRKLLSIWGTGALGVAVALTPVPVASAEAFQPSPWEDLSPVPVAPVPGSESRGVGTLFEDELAAEPPAPPELTGQAPGFVPGEELPFEPNEPALEAFVEDPELTQYGVSTFSVEEQMDWSDRPDRASRSIEIYEDPLTGQSMEFGVIPSQNQDPTRLSAADLSIDNASSIAAGIRLRVSDQPDPELEPVG